MKLTKQGTMVIGCITCGVTLIVGAIGYAVNGLGVGISIGLGLSLIIDACIVACNQEFYDNR